jgi:Integrase core domain.
VSYSGYLDVQQLKGYLSYEVIEQLKKWFSVHAIPEELQTDNGTLYMSTEFKIFKKEWKFSHVTSSPHHHQGNGLAEKAVQTAKNTLRKCSLDK